MPGRRTRWLLKQHRRRDTANAALQTRRTANEWAPPLRERLLQQKAALRHQLHERLLCPRESSSRQQAMLLGARNRTDRNQEALRAPGMTTYGREADMPVRRLKGPLSQSPLEPRPDPERSAWTVITHRSCQPTKTSPAYYSRLKSDQYDRGSNATESAGITRDAGKLHECSP